MDGAKDLTSTSFTFQEDLGQISVSLTHTLSGNRAYLPL